MLPHHISKQLGISASDAEARFAEIKARLAAMQASPSPVAPRVPDYDPLRMVATGIQFTKHHDDPENTFRLYNGMGSIDFMLMVDLNQNPPQLVLVSCSTIPKP